jgi:hypothetical protein
MGVLKSMFQWRVAAQPERPRKSGLFASGAENTGHTAALSIVHKLLESRQNQVARQAF